jgi:hypothetical protein
MLPGDSIYRQLKPLLGVRDMRLWTWMTGGQRCHCGPHSSEEAGTWTLGRGARRERSDLLFLLVLGPPFGLDGFGCVNNLWHTFSPLRMRRRWYATRPFLYMLKYTQREINSKIYYFIYLK